MRHRTHKADANQEDIVSKLRAIGASVLILSQVGDNAPDLLVGYKRNDFLLEVKSATGELREGQLSFINRWNGRKPVVVRTWEEALRSIGATK